MRLAFLIIVISFSAAAAEYKVGPPVLFRAMCDASAGIAVSSNRFIVANDEDNVLRVYDSQNGGPPLRDFNFSGFLRAEAKSPEADIEGVARVDNRVYWISSHGLNQQGERRINRCQFFGTDLSMEGNMPVLKPAGKPYRELLRDLLNEPGLARFNLAKAASTIPKIQGALDIEGLAAAPSGTLFIGLRNPLSAGKALVIPLRNPSDLLEGRRAIFGEAILLDLDGKGIRDIVFTGDHYLIIAGSIDGSHSFALYVWAGPGSPAHKIKVKGLNAIRPEALLMYGNNAFQLLSDDGTRNIQGRECKTQNASLRQFRGVWINPR